MHSSASPSVDSNATAASNEVHVLRSRVVELERQLDWFRRQIFGQTSERRIVASETQAQLPLAAPAQPLTPPPALERVGAHTRRKAQAPERDDSGLFFDASKVPLERIELANPEVAGLTADQYEVIEEKSTYHLAQRPGSYVVLQYVRPVVKLKAPQRIVCPSAPVSVIEGSRADVSFIAGLLLDKFAYPLPLYRQHRRLEDAGFQVSRPWLTQLVHKACALLEPIHDAQLDSIRLSRVKAMDETPIKAARAGPGKMKTGYFWPIYGELDEVSFPYFPTRSTQHVFQALGLTAGERAVLLSDGYTAYERYAQRTGITHAQCWAHTRRHLFEAQRIEPQRAAMALDQIGKLYQFEDEIRTLGLLGEAKKSYRQAHATPVVEAFFGWIQAQFDAQGLLPSSPFTHALAYAREREIGLKVYLDDPQVAIDTNHLERALRVIPMGRKNWLFCWTEVGAKYVGVMQSLIVTCRLHDINPYDYLVDVLQRISEHPAARVAELTPRRWKVLFADNPIRSALHKS